MHRLRHTVFVRILSIPMELYTPLYILLLLAGAILQAVYALCCRLRRPVPFTLVACGACAVLVSAYLERDVVLGCGQLLLLCILWRLGKDVTGVKHV